MLIHVISDLDTPFQAFLFFPRGGGTASNGGDPVNGKWGRPFARRPYTILESGTVLPESQGVSRQRQMVYDYFKVRISSLYCCTETTAPPPSPTSLECIRGPHAYSHFIEKGGIFWGQFGEDFRRKPGKGCFCNCQW